VRIPACALTCNVDNPNRGTGDYPIFDLSDFDSASADFTLGEDSNAMAGHLRRGKWHCGKLGNSLSRRRMRITRTRSIVMTSGDF